MPVQTLSIQHFRNLHSEKLEFSLNFNLIFGKNGSGKTSLLEAVYYLGRNKSFKSHINQRVINFNASEFTLYAQIDNKQTLGIQKSLEATPKLKLNGESLEKKSELTRLLPILMLNYDAFDWITGGAQGRRQSIDWVLFHVERQYQSAWQFYQKALKQRNQAIKQRLKPNEIKAWDNALVEQGEKLTMLRQKYFPLLKSSLIKAYEALLPEKPLDISFDAGFDLAIPLKKVLEANFSDDMRRGFTQKGPHRADLVFTTDGVPVKDIFSRGQQKVLLFAMLLAQLDVYSALQSDKPKAIVLIDDLAAELDNVLLARVINCLNQAKAQVFLTAINPSDIDSALFDISPKTFHVEQGRLYSSHLKVPT